MEVEILKLLKVKWKDKYKINNNNIDEKHIT